MRASVCLCLTLATVACPAEDQHVRGNDPIPDCDETGCEDADTFCSGNGKCLDIGTCGVDADCDAVHLCNGTDALCHPGSACGGMLTVLLRCASAPEVILKRSHRRT